MIVFFVLGFLAGALALYYYLWRTDGLVPGHLLARAPVPLAWVRGENPRPVPQAPTPSPAAVAPATAGLPVLRLPGPGEPTAPPLTPLAGFVLGRDVIAMPVEGAHTTDLHDDFEELRGKGRRHEAIDIMAPRGTPVLAAVDGSIEKLFTSKAGGLTIYEFDRNREYCYYYAHLDRYAESLKEGQLVHRGDSMGYVGSTGDAVPQAPHLHFAIFRLGPGKQWWIGTPINPYPYLLATR